MRVVWSPSALREVVQIFDYLMDFNPYAAAQVSAGLIEAGDGLEFPHRGRPLPAPGLRELVTSYPYIIRYRVTRQEVRILRVRHTSRQPTKA